MGFYPDNFRGSTTQSPYAPRELYIGSRKQSSYLPRQLYIGISQNSRTCPDSYISEVGHNARTCPGNYISEAGHNLCTCPKNYISGLPTSTGRLLPSGLHFFLAIDGSEFMTVGIHPLKSASIHGFNMLISNFGSELLGEDGWDDSRKYNFLNYWNSEQELAIHRWKNTLTAGPVALV